MTGKSIPCSVLHRFFSAGYLWIFLFLVNPWATIFWSVYEILRPSFPFKIPEISGGTSNGTDHFGLVRTEYSRPGFKVVFFDQSGHFCRSDRNVRFHLTKLLSPVPLFCILSLTRTITKRAEDWIGSVQPECIVPLGKWNFRNFKPEFLLNGKRPWLQFKSLADSAFQIKNKNLSHFYCSMFVFSSRIYMT